MAWIQPNHLTVNQTMTRLDLFRGQCFHFILQQYYSSKRFKIILNCERNFAFWHTVHTINIHIITNLIFSPKIHHFTNLCIEINRWKINCKLFVAIVSVKLKRKTSWILTAKLIIHMCKNYSTKNIHKLHRKKWKNGKFFILNQLACSGFSCVITCYPLIFLIFRFISSVWTRVTNIFQHFSWNPNNFVRLNTDPTVNWINWI